VDWIGCLEVSSGSTRAKPERFPVHIQVGRRGGPPVKVRLPGHGARRAGGSTKLEARGQGIACTPHGIRHERVRGQAGGLGDEGGGAGAILVFHCLWCSNQTTRTFTFCPSTSPFKGTQPPQPHSPFHFQRRDRNVASFIVILFFFRPLCTFLLQTTFAADVAVSLRHLYCCCNRSSSIAPCSTSQQHIHQAAKECPSC